MRLVCFGLFLATVVGIVPARAQIIRPPARNQPALAVDGLLRVLVFGGFGSDDELLGDTWQCTRDGWSELTVGPGSRGSHALVFVNDRIGFLLFGGISRGVRRADTWLFSDRRWVPWTGDAPPARSAHALATDASRERVVLFGGSGDGGLLGDTWEWSGEDWEQHTTSGPSPRRNHAMAYDPLRQVTVLFGGADSTGRLADTWIWNGRTWAELEVSATPRPRDHHAMTYSSRLRGVVAYGGWDGEYLSDLWRWTGSAWEMIAQDGPARSGRPGLGEGADGLLLYGGMGPEGYVQSTFVFRDDSWVPARHCP